MKFFSAFIAAILMMAAFTAGHAAIVGGDEGESYSATTYKELAQTMIMLDAQDITNVTVADEYAKMFFCGLWKDNHKDDFDWAKIRQQIVARVSSKKEYYRIQYQVMGTVFLGTYNFDTQDFPFTKETALTRVGSMVLLDRMERNDASKGIKKVCGSDDLSPAFPLNYLIVMNQPLTLDRLKIPMDDAKLLLDKMVALKNTDRRLYVRFRYRISAMDKLPLPAHMNLRRDRGVARGEITQVDVFYDHDFTKFLTSVQLK